MMPVRFDEYLKEPKSMDLETALRLHDEMLGEIGTDPDSVELYEELCRAAARYANFRAWWLLWDKEKKAEQDEGRTASHNALIVKFNQLAQAGILQMFGQADDGTGVRMSLKSFLHHELVLCTSLVIL